jgi:large subunit ribosomal protein L21
MVEEEMVYAIIETGGKQYRVEQGQELLIERLPHVQPGQEVEFERVLLISDDGEIDIGTPYLERAKVRGRIEEEVKGKKITAFTYKPKKRYRRKLGHRQKYMRASIEEIRG